MMRYNLKFIVVLTVVAVLIGCSGESYPGLEYEPVMAESLINRESGQSAKVTVSVNPSSFFTNLVTRGVGPFDASNNKRFDNAWFYVFAFRDRADQQGTLTYTPSFRQRSSDGSVDCLVDGSNELLGMPARIDAMSGVLKMKKSNGIADTTLYYGSRHQDIGYNFYVYHIDDFVPDNSNASRDDDGIYYDMEIDGTRDIMVGTSPRLTKEVLDRNYEGVVESLSAEQYNYVLNIGNYSAYSAYFGINPIVHMQHTLAQFKFIAHPADKTAKDICFTKIEMESRYAGRLYVATAQTGEVGFTFSDDRKYIPLMERNSLDPDGDGTQCYVPLDQSKYTVNWVEGSDNPPVVIGGNMLLPPDISYRLRVEYKQLVDAESMVYKTVSAEYDLKAPTIEESRDPSTGEFAFIPPNVYTVNLHVYGGQSPFVTIGLEGWQSGDEFIVDNE